MSDLGKILEHLIKLEDGQKEIKSKLETLEAGQKENTAILKALEHKAEVNKAEHDKMSIDIVKMSGSIEGIRSDMSSVEVLAAKNNLDIAKLKAVK